MTDVHKLRAWLDLRFKKMGRYSETELKLFAIANTLLDACEWQLTAKVNIGNDESGNLTGLPDGVMCRNRIRRDVETCVEIIWRSGENY